MFTLMPLSCTLIHAEILNADLLTIYTFAGFSGGSTCLKWPSKINSLPKRK